MKKVYFFAAAVAAALSVASCATSEVADSELATAEATPIGFGTFLDRVSRGAAAASPKATALDLLGLKASGFTVLAYYTGEADWTSYVSNAPANPNFMDDQDVTWSETSSVWEYSPAKYWPRKDNDGAGSDDWGKVTFFAFSKATGASADGVANNNPQITFTTQQSAADQVDLVAAVATNKTGDGGGKVQFQFNHILSKIGFAAKLAENYAATVEVQSLKIFYKASAVVKSGVYTFNSDNSIGAWTMPTDYLTDITTGDELFSGNQTLDNVTTSNLCGNNSYLMFIPQMRAAGDLSIELKCVVTQTNLASYTTTLKADLPAVAGGWKAGKAYTYNLLVTLSGIGFGTMNIVSWEDGTDQPNDTPVLPLP